MKWFHTKRPTNATRQLESSVEALDSLGYFKYAPDARSARAAAGRRCEMQRKQRYIARGVGFKGWTLKE